MTIDEYILFLLAISFLVYWVTRCYLGLLVLARSLIELFVAIVCLLIIYKIIGGEEQKVFDVIQERFEGEMIPQALRKLFSYIKNSTEETL